MSAGAWTGEAQEETAAKVVALEDSLTAEVAAIHRELGTRDAELGGRIDQLGARLRRVETAIRGLEMARLSEGRSIQGERIIEHDRRITTLACRIENLEGYAEVDTRDLERRLLGLEDNQIKAVDIQGDLVRQFQGLKDLADGLRRAAIEGDEVEETLDGDVEQDIRERAVATGSFPIETLRARVSEARTHRLGIGFSFTIASRDYDAACADLRRAEARVREGDPE